MACVELFDDIDIEETDEEFALFCDDVTDERVVVVAIIKVGGCEVGFVKCKSL